MNAEEYRTYERERKRAYRSAHPKAPRPFVGVDGEGGTREDGRHVYLLLRAGGRVLETGQELTPAECLDFLSALPAGFEYVSYFFDYDVTMMLRALPVERVERLLDREARGLAKDGTRLRQVLPVDVGHGAYQIDYLPRKFFKVRRRLNEHEWDRWVTVSDVSSFFQQSFLKTLDAWGVGEADREQIEAGKTARAEFGVMTEEIRSYNDLECRLLANLMEEFCAVCIDVGYVPTHWQGPGYLAVSMLRKNGLCKTKDLPPVPSQVWEASNAAFYGGRFETTAVGPVPGPIYQYDINSAYPDALLKLPCLVHGEWKPGVSGEFTISEGHFQPTEPAFLYGLPIRDKDGGIYCPAEGNGWYWEHEIKSAKHQTFSRRQSWSYVKKCDCKPFDWVSDVYAERIALGKTGRGKILKLGLNSLYGKTAQSIGGAPYANPVWASLITSLVRAKLAEAVHMAPECTSGLCGTSAVMLATDAVFSLRPLPLLVSPGLGDWDLSEHADMFVIQPGVYWTSDRAKPKTRGIPQSKVVEYAEEFEIAYANLHTLGDIRPVRIPLTVFVGLRSAWHRHKYAEAGQWLATHKDISFGWQSKRDESVLPVRSLSEPMRPYPIRGNPGLVSVPYSKEIGRWRELERIDAWDQPDFGSDTFAFTED